MHAAAVWRRGRRGIANRKVVPMRMKTGTAAGLIDLLDLSRVHNRRFLLSGCKFLRLLAIVINATRDFVISVGDGHAIVVVSEFLLSVSFSSALFLRVTIFRDRSRCVVTSLNPVLFTVSRIHKLATRNTVSYVSDRTASLDYIYLHQRPYIHISRTSNVRQIRYYA